MYAKLMPRIILSICLTAPLLVSNLTYGVSGDIGFEHFNKPNNLPYPTTDIMPKPCDLPYPAHQPSAPPYPAHVYGSITACTLPSGIYAIDVYSKAVTDNYSLYKAKLYLHVNEAGILAFRTAIQPIYGAFETYVVIPYATPSDLQQVCNGDKFFFTFTNVKLENKKLAGHLSGELSGRSSIRVEGLIERYDPSYNSRVTISVPPSLMKRVSSYN